MKNPVVVAEGDALVGGKPELVLAPVNARPPPASTPTEVVFEG
jgi:hypothetical protein